MQLHQSASQTAADAHSRAIVGQQTCQTHLDPLEMRRIFLPQPPASSCISPACAEVKLAKHGRSSTFSGHLGRKHTDGGCCRSAIAAAEHWML